MSQPDERELFRRLGDDAHRAHLAAPAQLRRRSDRRTAVRAAVGTVAVVVAVGGVLVGSNALGGSAAPDPAETGTATPTQTQEPTTSPSTSQSGDVDPGPTMVTETTQAATPPIPEAAWLDADDLGYGVGHKGRFEPPSLCGQPLVAPELLESGAAIVRGTRDAIYKETANNEYDVPEGTTKQSLVLLESERAADDLMNAIEAQVEGCPEESTRNDPSEITYTLVDAQAPGATPDRHLLIDVSTSYALYEEIQPLGVDRFDSFVSVVQVRDAISILEVHAWEAGDTSLEEGQRFVGPATVRLRNWRNG